MNIIARKPKDNEGTEYIVAVNAKGEFVSATANKHSLSHNEWFWGHYFQTQEEAMKHFNSRDLYYR